MKHYSPINGLDYTQKCAEVKKMVSNIFLAWMFRIAIPPPTDNSPLGNLQLEATQLQKK